MPTLTQLEYIIAVDEHKNFSRAAEDCHVSQPSLSAQVHKIEDELGIIIFDRSKKPIITTSQGEEVIKRAKVVLSECRKLVDIGTNERGVSGYFHLGVIPSVAPYLIPLFIEDFSKTFPDVKLKISELKTENIIKSLYDEKIDAGLLVTPLYDDKIIERSLYYEKFHIFSSKNHELYKRKLISDTDLDANSVWLLEEGHCLRDQVIRICSLNRSTSVLENVNFASGSMETLMNLVRKGRGYTLIPELATSNLPSSEIKNNLKQFKKPIPTREVSIVHSRSFLKQNIIDALEEKILKNLPKSVASLKKKNIEVIDI
ncbi:MAG: LysR substrate-binding domain-containing protein [Bacteriovoracaceae bacterium]